MSTEARQFIARIQEGVRVDASGMATVPTGADVANFAEEITYRREANATLHEEVERLLAKNYAQGRPCKYCGEPFFAKAPSEGPVEAAKMQTCGKVECVEAWRDETKIFLEDGVHNAISGAEVREDGGQGKVRVDQRRRLLGLAGVKGDLREPFDPVKAGHIVEPEDPRKERSGHPARQFWIFSKARRFLFISGLLGHGKTRYAISIMSDYLMSNSGKTGMYLRVGDLGAAVSGHKLGEGLCPLEDQANRANILILDDLTLSATDARTAKLGADACQRIFAVRYDGPAEDCTITTASIGFSAPLSVPEGGWSRDPDEKARQMEATGETWLKKLAPWLASRFVEGWVVKLSGKGREPAPLAEEGET